MTSVIALGGNALVKLGQRGTAAEQRQNLREHLQALEPVLDGPVVITHGNGPQSAPTFSGPSARRARSRRSHSG